MSAAAESDVPTTPNQPAKKKRFGGLSSMLMIEIVAVAGGLLATIIYAFGSNRLSAAATARPRSRAASSSTSSWSDS